MTEYKTGRLPRSFDPRVPHHGMMKAILRQAGAEMPTLLTALDNALALPPDLGMMLNAQLGSCTAAAGYHFLQLITKDAQAAEVTEPDTCVEALYEATAGYRPGDPSTDNGANEQTVLAYLLNTGFPMADGSRHKIACYVETDQRNLDDVCEMIQEFGAAYIGFEVPSGFMEAGPPRVWDADGQYGAIEGGHCVLLSGFDRTDPANPSFNVISWGGHQWQMTAAFFRQYVDEVYGIADPLWIETTGKTPYGLSMLQIESLCIALREAPEMTDRGAEAAGAERPRSDHWPAVRAAQLARQPACAATGLTAAQGAALEAHHDEPFHLCIRVGRADLELDLRNLTTLCRHPIDVHLVLGHDDDFEKSDLDPQEAARLWRGKTEAEIKADQAWVARRATARKRLAEWSEQDLVEYRAYLDAKFPVDEALCAKYGMKITAYAG